MRKILAQWIIYTLALWAAAKFVPGIYAGGDWTVLVVVALIFGLVNALFRPILTLLSCPLLILTLGLFTLVINAILLLLASAIAEALRIPFHVDGFMPAFWGGLVVGIVSMVLSLVFGEDREAKRRRH